MLVYFLNSINTAGCKSANCVRQGICENVHLRRGELSHIRSHIVEGDDRTSSGTATNFNCPALCDFDVSLGHL
jgi:hypothetical protein